MLDARLPRVMVAMLERSRNEFLARAEALAKTAAAEAAAKAERRDIRYPRDIPGYPGYADTRVKLLRSA